MLRREIDEVDASEVHNRLEDFRTARGEPRVESEQYRIEGFPERHRNRSIMSR